MKEIEVKDLIKYINPFKNQLLLVMEMKPMGLQLVGLDLVFYGENQWLQFMYIKHVYSKHIFDQAKYNSICFMDQEHKNQLG